MTTRWMAGLLAGCLILSLVLCVGAAEERKSAVATEDRVEQKSPAEDSEYIKEAQKALTARGYDPGPVDGRKGAKSRAAIKAFQKAAGIEATGILDAQAARLLGLKPTQAAAPRITARADVIGEDQASLVVECISEDRDCLVAGNQKKRFTLSAKDKDLRARLKNIHKGDILELEVADEKGVKVLKDLSPKAVPVSRASRGWALSLSALGIVAVLWVVLRGNLPVLLVGKDNRYSNSKFQMAVWFGVFVTSYIATVWLRYWKGGGDFIGGVNIPQNLAILSGISAFTFAAAKGITIKNKEDARRKAEEAARKPGGAIANLLEARAPHQQIAQVLATITDESDEKVKPTAQAADRKLIPNLLDDDRGNPDIGDIQMLIITLLAVGVYLALVFKFLGSIELLRVVTLPDVDTTILATFGLGKGAYLAKKYAGEGA